MILIDSSAWIEFFTQGPLSKTIEREIKGEEAILVPTLVLYEVYKKICRLVSQEEALSAISLLSSFHIADLSREIALTAADLSFEYDLAMADSMILSTAQIYQARLLTLDTDFRRVPNVKLLKRS